jgi:hypothetical protein
MGIFRPHFECTQECIDRLFCARVELAATRLNSYESSELAESLHHAEKLLSCRARIAHVQAAELGLLAQKFGELFHCVGGPGGINRRPQFRETGRLGDDQSMHGKRGGP